MDLIHFASYLRTLRKKKSSVIWVLVSETGLLFGFYFTYPEIFLQNGHKSRVVCAY